jgi:hypothetical protein
MSQAIHAMAPEDESLVYRPDFRARKQYDKLYELYRELSAPGSVTTNVMRKLREFSEREGHLS